MQGTPGYTEEGGGIDHSRAIIEGGGNGWEVTEQHIRRFVEDVLDHNYEGGRRWDFPNEVVQDIMRNVTEQLRK